MAGKSYSVKVQAVQITDDLTVSDLLAFLAECDLNGPVGQLVVAKGRPPSLSLQNVIGKSVAEAGDWLVLAPAGLQCCSADEFARIYTAGAV